METLLRENIRLVWMMLLRQAPGKADYANLLQEGRIGLWQAILHYDPGRGFHFSSYAWEVIRHRIWQVVGQATQAEGGWEAQPAADRLPVREQAPELVAEDDHERDDDKTSRPRARKRAGDR